jgi:Dyp-type peroxidase family
MVTQRDFSQEPALALGSIQGDLLLGHEKDAEALVFFRIAHAAGFKHFIRHMPFTSAAAVYRPKGQSEALATGELPPNPRYSVAFTHAGLAALDVKGLDKIGPDAPFAQGLAARAVAELNDPDPKQWIVGQPAQELHGVFMITGKADSDVDVGLHRHFLDHPHGFEIVKILRGRARPGDFKGHEHFGFLDGVSQPGIRGCVDPGQTTPLTETHPKAKPTQGLPGQDLLWPGEFVFGYPAQSGNEKDPATVKGPVRKPPLPFMVNGAFLVVRRLEQLVPEMHAGSKAAADEKKIDPALLEAQLVGRWPSGAPLLLRPNGDDPKLGKDDTKNNNFEFEDDRQAVVCPWAAHIRKTYPRDEVPFSDDPKPGKDDVEQAEAATQRHRMLRRGIQFGPELTAEEIKKNRTIEQRGLLFKCYVTDIEAQFEFVQRDWVNNLKFSQPETDKHHASGIDAIIGQAPGGADRPFLGAGLEHKKPRMSFKPWVTMTGGGYFFAPSIDFLRSVR